MTRRSKFAEAAERWLRAHAPDRTIGTDELWNGLSQEHPDLTTPSETRKTPRWSCMRDLRSDPAFDVHQGTIALKK